MNLKKLCGIAATICLFSNFNLVINANDYEAPRIIYLNEEDHFFNYDNQEFTFLEEKPTECKYLEYSIPEYNGFKSYMDYNKLSCKTSSQYTLQKYFTMTTEDGMRMIDGRYCIAIGSYFNCKVGQYIDLVLENGTVIPCIMGDLKADVHTDSQNIFTMPTKCCSEFIVDTDKMNSWVKYTGDFSNYKSDWNSPVKAIRVYDKNILDERMFNVYE